MSRSLKKGPYVDPKLLKKIERMDQSGSKRAIRTWSRRSMITPDFVGHTFAIHNGKQFFFENRALPFKSFSAKI